MHRPIESPLRYLGAVMLLLTAATHLPLVPMHLEEAPYVGVLFIALSVVSIVLAAALVIRDSLLVWSLTSVVTALAVAAFLLSRTVGLPQIGDDVGNWGEPLGFPALAAEVVAALVAAVVLRRSSHRSPHRSSRTTL